MSDDMRCDARRINPRAHRDVVQKPSKTLTRHVSRRARGGKQPPPGLPPDKTAQRTVRGRGIAQLKPTGHRHARGRCQRHHPVLPALSPDQQQFGIATTGGDRQRDQFADAHPGGIKHLDQAQVAGAFGRAATGLRRGCQQRVHLGAIKRLWQALGTTRPGDADGGVILSPAFLKREAGELADR